jgi:hypothetical protein
VPDDVRSDYPAVPPTVHRNSWAGRAGFEADLDYTVDRSQLGLHSQHRRPESPSLNTCLHATEDVVNLPCGP